MNGHQIRLWVQLPQRQTKLSAADAPIVFYDGPHPRATCLLQRKKPVLGRRHADVDEAAEQLRRLYRRQVAVKRRPRAPRKLLRKALDVEQFKLVRQLLWGEAWGDVRGRVWGTDEGGR
eukprot:365921-Chlamydomonas_euryale.AAC.4